MNEEKNRVACGNYVHERINFDYYKVLFDPVRFDLFIYLLAYGAKNIKEITENFSQDRSVISRHLDLMNRHGMVEKRKENRNIYYDASREAVMMQVDETLDIIKKLILNAPPKESRE